MRILGVWKLWVILCVCGVVLKCFVYCGVEFGGLFGWLGCFV